MDRMLVIDPEECIDCGACEPECPVEAILPEDAIPDDWQPYVPINYAFPDKDAIHRMVDEVKPPGSAADEKDVLHGGGRGRRAALRRHRRRRHGGREGRRA